MMGANARYLALGLRRYPLLLLFESIVVVHGCFLLGWCGTSNFFGLFGKRDAKLPKIPKKKGFPLVSSCFLIFEFLLFYSLGMVLGDFAKSAGPA